jgi:predicted hydrocarbon binding protein
LVSTSHLEKYIDNLPPDNDLLEIPTKDAQNLFLSLCELFGKKGSRGLSLRVGREIARRVIEGRTGLVEAVLPAVRVAPEEKKIYFVLAKMVETANKWFTSLESGPIIELQENEDYFIIVHKDRFESDGISSQEPVCGVYTGMLQFAVEWAAGHPHEVKEIECRAMGYPADVFRVAKARQEET